MSGEGTGGGGALAVLLALWIGATALIVGERPFGDDNEEAPVSASPTIVVEAEEVVVFEASPEPSPTPAPELPECEGDACDAAVTRAELAEAFVRAFRLPVSTADYFTDDADVPQQAAINRVAAAGITTGCDEGRFCPDARVTRAQMATFLDRAVELPEADRDYFTDDAGLGHEGAINRLAAAGITTGCDEDRYCPDGIVTVGQLIRFLERALSIDAEPVA